MVRNLQKYGKNQKACATTYITQRGSASLKIPTFSRFFRNNFKKLPPGVLNNFGLCPPLGPVRRQQYPVSAATSCSPPPSQTFLPRGFVRKRFASRPVRA